MRETNRQVGSIVLVSCGSKKLDYRTPDEERLVEVPAEELYTSNLFRKSAEYARARGTWGILSALHGLVHPRELLRSYDIRLLPELALSWSLEVADEVAEAFPCCRRVELLAGAHYTRHLRPALEARGVEVLEPLAGLQIGERLAWLKRANAEASSNA